MDEIDPFMRLLNKNQMSVKSPGDSYADRIIFQLEEPWGKMIHHKHFSEDGFGMTDQNTIFYFKDSDLRRILANLKEFDTASMNFLGGKYYSGHRTGSIPHAEKDEGVSFQLGTIRGELYISPDLQSIIEKISFEESNSPLSHNHFKADLISDYAIKSALRNFFK